MNEMAEMAVPQQPHVETAKIRALRRTDLPFAARLHGDALPHGFFGRLGNRFLTRYYETFLASPHAVAFLAVADGVRAGVLVGTVANAAHYRWVLRHRGASLALAGLLALSTRPRELQLFLRTRALRYLRGFLRLQRRHPEARRTRPDLRCVAVLSHVAVDRSLRSAGTGAALVEAFVRAARARGCDEACLVTLCGPDGAGPFYRRLGWTHLEDRLDGDGRGISAFSRAL